MGTQNLGPRLKCHMEYYGTALDAYVAKYGQSHKYTKLFIIYSFKAFLRIRVQFLPDDSQLVPKTCQ